MASRSKNRNAQSRAQKRKLKQKKRRKEKSKNAVQSSTIAIGRRHQQQLEGLVPNAWPGENELDVAVFDENVYGKLSPDDQQQVSAVKQAFQWIAASRWHDAESAVAEIPRKSQVSEWRMLIRGMKHWFADDIDQANQSWSRLDPTRRPARIATALQLAHRDDLVELAAKHMNPPSESSSGEETVGALKVDVDRDLLLAAKVVRRTRIDRAAIKIASAGVSQKAEHEDEMEDCLLTIEKIKWLRGFASDFRHLEPKLVEALEVAALQRAMHQGYNDVFQKATTELRGPIHDRKNYLQSFLYFAGDPDSEFKEDEFLRKYLETDLPFNQEISQPLRNALLSTAWLKEAQSNVSLVLESPMRFGFFRDDRDHAALKKTIRKSFVSSIEAYPANRLAHEKFSDWLESEVDDDTATKNQREKCQAELMAAMQGWAKAIPGDAIPQAFLAETLLEQEKLEEAAPYVQWLVKSRPDDPRLKALPWKLKLLETMQLCRRKTTLSKVPTELEGVKSQWPSWLSPRWLPYYTAAWMLRSGDIEDYEKQRDLICSQSQVQREGLADACMMLGAAQKMKVVAADLKPLRVPVDTAVKNLKSISNEELIAAGSFFWDMYKAKIQYPAFRMHGSKFGRELLKRIKAQPSLVAKLMLNPAFLDTMLWCSEHRFWGDGYESKMPEPLKKMNLKMPLVAAAQVNGSIKSRWGDRDDVPLKLAEFLRKSARSESDPFYRYWFTELADKAEDQRREAEADIDLGGMFGNMFENMFGYDEDDNEDDEYECDCPNCRARRAGFI